MKERRQKEEAHRSAVSGKKIKLKIKKSSKDKEVNVNLFFFFNKVVDLLIGNFYSHSTAGHCTLRGEGVGGGTMPSPLMKYH